MGIVSTVKVWCTFVVVIFHKYLFPSSSYRKGCCCHFIVLATPFPLRGNPKEA